MLNYDKISKGIEVPYSVKDKPVKMKYGFKVVRIGFAYVVIQK